MCYLILRDLNKRALLGDLQQDSILPLNQDKSMYKLGIKPRFITKAISIRDRVQLLTRALLSRETLFTNLRLTLNYS